MNLRKYSGACAKCPKCSTVGADTAYYATGRCLHSDGGEHSTVNDVQGSLGQARMHRTCQTCGYQWDELPADSDLVSLERQVEVMVTAIQEELSCLWDDLGDAMRDAMNGKWSIACDNLATRIEVLTRIVGPYDHQDVPAPLVLDGTYERLHAEWGIEHDPIDHESLQAWWDDYRARQGATVTPLRT